MSRWKDDPIVEQPAQQPALQPGYLRAPPVEQVDQPEQVGRGERFLMGLGDPFMGAAQMLERVTPQPIRDAVNRADQFLFENTGGLVGGVGSMDERVRQREADYQARMQATGQDGFDGMRLAGNIINPANIPAFRMMTAPSVVGRLGQGGAVGGVYGAAQPVTGGDPDDFAAEKAMQTAIGAGTGAVGETLLGPLARLGQRGRSPEVSLLMDEGVRPTAAQIAGGGARATEDMMTSIPMLGTVATANQRRALEQFNQAAINRAVTPVGGNVKGSGREAVVEAQRILDSAYDRARSAVANPIDFDPAFVAQISDLDNLGAGLTGEMQSKLRSFMTRKIGARLNAGRVGADDFKELDSALSQQISKFGRSTDVTHQEYADVLRELQRGLNDQMARTNPAAGELFRQADDGYRHLVIVENATNAAAAGNGVFTPLQLQTAARAADDSVRKRDMIRGTATFADLAQAGQSVLGNRYPDSGTAGRTMLGAALGGGAVGAATAPTTTAMAAGGLGLLTGGYAAANPLARFAATNPALARILQAVPTSGAAVGGGQGGLLMGED